MQPNDLANQAGAWLRGTGPESDIVISTRIRLARNIEGYPFVTRLEPGQQAELAELLQSHVTDQAIVPHTHYFDLTLAADVERRLLVERHLISREHEEASGERGVAVEETEAVSIMVNEEDHLRMQVLSPGLELDRTWETLNGIDSALAARLPYAFSERLGFLTACPTNVGTALRA